MVLAKIRIFKTDLRFSIFFDIGSQGFRSGNRERFLLSRVEKSCLEVDFFEQRKSALWVPKVFSLCAGGCFDTFWAEAARTSVC